MIFLLCSFFVKPMEASGTSGLLVGAFSMAAIAALLVLVSRGALGLGDFHLAPLLGAILGWFSPSAVLLAWMITAIAGALFTTVGLVSKRLSRGSLIPYGPFMIFGTLVAVVAVGIRG
jgi:prepilin signal peptidase PulO-like enzyme (type II secretory pathway)